VVGVLYEAEVSGPPVFQHPYALTPDQRRVVEDTLDKLLKQGIISPGQSEWSSPILLIPKKNGEWRVAVDYRRVNARMRNDVMPLPRIDQALEAMAGSTFFSAMDAVHGFWQIKVAPNT
jgi:hypothetical protein